ncbi:MAG: sucrose synthase [Phycisphaerae bacterium]
MTEALTSYLGAYRENAYALLRHFANLGKPFLLRSELLNELQKVYGETPSPERIDTPLYRTIRVAQEAAVSAPWMCLAARPRIGRWTYLRFHIETVAVEEISVSEFLGFKERLVNGDSQADDWPLEIDLEPFNRDFPKLRESRSIGQGVAFLNRRLSSDLYKDLDNGDKSLLDFLRVHHVKGVQLMLNDRINDVTELRRAIRQADDLLRNEPPDAEWASVEERLPMLGFEPGWGRTVERMRDTLSLLSDILEAPEPSNLERFLSRVPMIFSIVILSPHGFFGQSNVLGLPDTGGQIVYILDQVRALEKEMRGRLWAQGIKIEPQILVVTRLIPEARGTTCDQRTEPIMGTQNARILRIPFRSDDGGIVAQWVSRFKVWPYLERFALEAEKEILAELGRPPALIIGNYSDGCLVASLMSRRLHVTQCNVAHALEKSKYVHSDLYWEDHEDSYHFSCQFTADLISMNTADFVITSTYQEIAGTRDSMGQYESYHAFTMPGLQRVVNGINIFDPKFNVVSPGADASVFFTYAQGERRLTSLHPQLDTLVFGAEKCPDVRGCLIDRSKPLVFTMARLDRIKNVAGLVDWYGSSPQLRRLANLFIVGGHVDPKRSNDREEREQIHAIHALVDRHGLDGEFRWVCFQPERNLVGELYRYVADRRGVFVQPALFEGFGLSVIEAMCSGLPTFATCNGGPLEIIEDGVSGFHIDPNRGEEAAAAIAAFIEKSIEDPTYWESFSARGIERIQARYTWELYARRMMTLSRVYGFWRFVTNLERDETRRYLDMLYGLQYRPLAKRVPRPLVRSSKVFGGGSAAC